MSEEFPLGAVQSTGIANNMSSTFMATTQASTSYFLQQLATVVHQNATRNLVISPSFHREPDSSLTPEELYFQKASSLIFGFLSAIYGSAV